MPKLKRKKASPLAIDQDGLIEVEVIEPRLGRKRGDTYKVDPMRAAKLVECGWARLKGADDG